MVPMDALILIGGAPTAGKSTAAQLLSKHLDIPWVSTDQIREVMRETVNPQEYPAIFNTRKYNAEQFLNTFSAEEIVAMEMKESEETWKGVQAFIHGAYPWKNFIIEGIGILPHLAHELEENECVRAVFLVDEDADRIRDVVFKRGLWDEAKSYSDSLKEKEVEWALLFSHILKKEVEKFGYPWVEVSKSEQDLGKILSALKIPVS